MLGAQTEKRMWSLRHGPNMSKPINQQRTVLHYGIIVILVIAGGLFPRSVFAAACATNPFPSVGNATITNCATTVATATTTGADNGTSDGAGNTAVVTLVGTDQANPASITINGAASGAGGVLVTGSLSITGAYSSISLQTGTAVKPQLVPGGTSANIWVTDADGDRYAPSSYTTYTTSGAGRTRVGNLLGGPGIATTTGSTGNTDCYDSSNLAYPGSTTCGTNRGDTSMDYNCSGSAVTTGCTLYYSSATIACQYAANCGEYGTACCSHANCNYSNAAVGCGVAGYQRDAGTFCVAPSCGSCTTYYTRGTAGTQACN